MTLGRETSVSPSLVQVASEGRGWKRKGRLDVPFPLPPTLPPSLPPFPQRQDNSPKRLANVNSYSNDRRLARPPIHKLSTFRYSPSPPSRPPSLPADKRRERRVRQAPAS